MKKTVFIFTCTAIFTCWLQQISAQNVGIGTSNPLNKLHVAGGFRLDTLTGVNGSGLLTHDANGVVYGLKFTGNSTDVLRGDGTFGSGGAGLTGWALTGNSGTNPATHFLGTTDNNALVFRVNNLYHGRLDSSIFFGSNAGQASTGKGNIGIGNGALHTITNRSLLIAIGDSALYSNTTGFHNIAIGYQSLYANTTGYQNTAIGTWTLISNTTGHDNIAIGLNAMRYNLDGSENAGLGFQTLFSNTSGSFNTAYGNFALQLNVTGNQNSAFGRGALNRNTGSSNSAFGTSALFFNESGQFNTASGHRALANNTIGSNNVAAGYQALFNNTIGNGNVGIGFSVGSGNTKGSNLTLVGTQANVATDSLQNATAIGFGAIVNASNKVRIGNSNVTVIEGQVAYTFPSDGRFKTNVTESIKGLEFIMKLRPVAYHFQTKKYDDFLSSGEKPMKLTANINYTESENLRHNGFIAQEVEQAAKEAGYEFDGVIAPKNSREAYGLSYSQFVVPLVKAVQEQQQIIEKQQKQIDNLLRRIEALEKK